jgi:hypothetical protein
MNRLILAFLLLAGVASAQDKPAKSYPEHGTVVAIRARTVSPGMILGPSHTVTTSVSPGTYRIETDAQFYELSDRSKKPTMALGQVIDFRIEKGNAYVRNAKGKEDQYHIVGQELKPNKK